MSQNWVEVLTKCALFQGIETDELGVMIQCLKPKMSSYKRNEIIATAGDKFNGIGFILSGEAVVAKENAAGNRVVLTMLKPGDMFGEMAAFSGNNVWPATVSVQSSCKVLFLPPDKILGECKKLCPCHRRLVINMLRILSNKALTLNRKVEYLAVKSMRGKIANFLLEQFNKTCKTTFMMPMNRNELADFLNVSRPSLSREMGRLRDEGIIEFHRSSVHIKNIEALQTMVE